MIASLRTMLIVLFVGIAETPALQPKTPDLWQRIRSLREPDTPEQNLKLDNYLKSLTAEEMLIAARQACDEVTNRPPEITVIPLAAAGELHVGLCLQYYFDKIALDPGAQELLAVVRDKEDCAVLRAGIIRRMGDSPETQSEQMLQRYMETHRPELDTILTNILRDRNDDPIVRAEVIDTLTWLLAEQARKITLSDANRRALWEQTHKAVLLGELMRSGELTLTEETLKALEPVEARALTYVKLFGAILAKEKNEPEQLRERARRALERQYKRLPFPELDKEIDNALQQAGE